jgi:glycosyltransferase involved in cell wall biosynthesis
LKKVFVLPPGEDWIVDRFVKEWREDNADISVTDPAKADVVWLYADWCWQQVPRSVLNSKKVVVTVHHVVPDKFGSRELAEFQLRDQFVTAYHVPNVHTAASIRSLTSKSIHLIPYWANQKIWKRTHPGHRVAEIWEKYNLPQGIGSERPTFFIGSFQRDTEGHDLISPKLEKGPDLLADAIISYRDRIKPYCPLEVILGGWRRQYLMSRLAAAGIRYHYFEKPSQATVNELYQIINLYPVTARHEGGPQSLIECGILGIPVVSRDVGMASQLLPATAISDDVTTAIPSVPDVSKITLPSGYAPFRKLFEDL